MKKVRFTLSMPSIQSGDLAAQQADAREIGSEEGQVSNTSRPLADRIAGGDERDPRTRRATASLAEGMMPARRATGATLRSALVVQSAVAMPPAQEPIVLRTETTRLSRQEQATAKAREEFTGLMQASRELILILEMLEEDRTPTRDIKETDALFHGLIKSLVAVQLAVKQSDRRGSPASCLLPAQHRQMGLIADAIEETANQFGSGLALSQADGETRERLLTQLRLAAEYSQPVRPAR